MSLLMSISEKTVETRERDDKTSDMREIERDAEMREIEENAETNKFEEAAETHKEERDEC